jgi:hypothetical protein
MTNFDRVFEQNENKNCEMACVHVMWNISHFIENFRL